jgi:murein L,D-transpeptidase YafK
MADSTRKKRRLNGRVTLVVLTLLVAVAGTIALYASAPPQLSAAFLPATFAKSSTSLRGTAPGAGAVPATTAADTTLVRPSAAQSLEAEALLVKTLAEISHNRMGSALVEIDKVINAYPNFRLAHLIKGDLLLARGRPINAIGSAPEAPPEQLADLRDEARARVDRQQSSVRPKDQVPRYLLQMPPEQRFALVVDTAKSTLYVYENVKGEARYIADYYVTIGKRGMDKFREGDNKTPLGVYHVTGNITREQLNSRYGKAADEYGLGALPISYPNEWDRRSGRNGHGIWLHGVPFDTYSHPPRASNGCVALTNEDFMAIAKSVQVGVTPVIIANGVEWSNPKEIGAVRSDLNQAFETWRRDWESLNTETYLKHYSPQFASGTQNLRAWSEYKREVNSAKTWIKVKTDNVSMYFYPGANDLAVVTFDQDYSSSNLAGQTRRRQYWKKETGGWRILYEGMAATS